MTQGSCNICVVAFFEFLTAAKLFKLRRPTFWIHSELKRRRKKEKRGGGEAGKRRPSPMSP